MKKILLTGATDGIGLATAKLLAAQGHHLLLHGRNEKKLIETEKVVKQSFPQVKIESFRADLSRFSDIRTMLRSIINSHNSIDIIINNAGVFKTQNSLTSDGLDVRFVVNTLAPYIISKTLLSLLADNGRIINLSSAAQTSVNLEAMKGKQSICDDFQAYAQSKLAITIWSQEIARALKANQVMMAVNPGSLLATKMVKEGFGIAGNDLSIGADILIRTALSEEFAQASGKYFDNDAKEIASPHSDTQDKGKCTQVVNTIQHIVDEFYQF